MKYETYCCSHVFLMQNVQWYPGHIAKSFIQLQKLLFMVDITLEILDARAISSTSHPQILSHKTKFKWVIVINRIDMVTEKDIQLIKAFQKDRKNLFTNAKSGKGISELRKAITTIGNEINIERLKKNKKPRPVKCIVVGFPNVGKSAIINHLIGRRICPCAAKPGITRSYQWVNINKELEILDGPGILPRYFIQDSRAHILATIGCIDDIAHENIGTASFLVTRLRGLPTIGQIAEKFRSRYGVKLENTSTSLSIIKNISSLSTYNNEEITAKKLIKDYRNLKLGSVCIEV